MANKSISQLTAGGAVSGTDLFPDVQTVGVGPVKVTATQMATFFWYNATLVSPDIGAATGTSLALSGATLGTNKLAVNGTTLLGGATTVSTGGLTIGVQQTTQGTIVLANTAAGAYPVTLQSSNSTSAAWTLTLPVTAGSSGYILTTNGSGVTSWTNPTSLGIDLDVGTTPITNGTAGRLLYQGAGDVLQESANLTFSTAALTLGVQQSAQGSVVLANTAAGAYSTTIQSSNSASAAWTLTLPTTAGSASYALITDGSGNTSWVQAGSISTGFTQGSVIFAGASGVLSQDNTNFFWDNSNDRLGIKTATPAVSLAINAVDAILLPKGADGDRPAGVAGYMRYNTTSNQFEGYNGSAWGNIGGGATISDDTSTAATEYPVFANASSGSLTTAYVSSTKLTYKPSTGDLISVAVGSSSGVVINANSITATYSIPSGYNGFSSGPVTIASGGSITVPSGSNWTVV